MKIKAPPHTITRTSPILALLAIAGMTCVSSHAATFTWDGGGDGVDLGDANNWNPNGIPTGGTSDVLQWNGTVVGPLSLAYNTAQAGLNTSPGISISLTADQTSALTIDGGGSALRLNGSGISIASGAGAFTLGNGVGTANFTVFNGSMAMVNNSSNIATISSDAVFATTLAGLTTFAFSGSGNWQINTNLRSTNNAGGNQVSNTGTGTLIMNAANTYTGQTTIGANGGSAVVRATATGALGSGTVFIAGNGGSNRLELSGGVTLGNALAVNGRGNTLGQTDAIRNLSGNNTLNGTITVNTGGSHNTIRSDAGTLNLNGATAVTSAATGARHVLFTGDGDVTVGGAITNGNSSGLVIDKDGSGTLTLNGTNTYTGPTTLSSGALLVNGSLAAGSTVTVTGGTLGGSGSIGGSVSVGGVGVLSAGTSIESLATGALTMSSGTSFVFEAADNSAAGADLVAVNGALSLTSVTLDLDSSTLAALAGGGWTAGDKLTLISYLDGGSGIISGFDGYDDDTVYLFGSNQWLFDYNDIEAGGNFDSDATASGQNRFVTMTLIPEPSIALLGGLGLLGLLRRRR